MKVLFPLRDAADTSTVANLMKHVAAKLPAKWFAVGLQLGIEPSQLEGFETAIGTKDQDRLWCKVSHQWKQEQKELYTWNTIISALDSVTEKETATQIREYG